MPALLIGASVFSILLAIIMTVVASKLVRENRARSAARIAALQAVVAETADARVEPAVSLITSREEPWDEQPWDLELHESVESTQVERRVAEPPISSLFETPIPPAPSHRWAWMAVTGLVIASAAGAFYAVSTGVIGRVVAANSAKTTAQSSSPIELLSLRNSTDPSGNFVVTGLVQNPAAGTSMHGVFAVVYLFDAEGRYFASSRAPLQSAVLSPGGEAAFSVTVLTSSRPSVSSLPSTIEVSKYRVSFQQEDGAGVNHVDRRGTLPEGTTGDAVQTTPPGTPQVAARKIG